MRGGWRRRWTRAPRARRTARSRRSSQSRNLRRVPDRSDVYLTIVAVTSTVTLRSVAGSADCEISIDLPSVTNTVSDSLMLAGLGDELGVPPAGLVETSGVYSIVRP